MGIGAFLRDLARAYALERDVDAGIARRRAKRLAQPPRAETRRFARARGKVDQLRAEIARRAGA